MTDIDKGLHKLVHTMLVNTVTDSETEQGYVNAIKRAVKEAGYSKRNIITYSDNVGYGPMPVGKPKSSKGLSNEVVGVELMTGEEWYKKFSSELLTGSGPRGYLAQVEDPDKMLLLCYGAAKRASGLEDK